MSEKSLQQGNPTLDKMSTRLNLAGAGVLGPILKGFAGTITLTIGRDEELLSVRIYSSIGAFNNPLSGTFVSQSDGSQLWSTDIVYGTDTASGLTGGSAARNYLEWIIRKLEIPNEAEAPADFDTPLDRPYFNATRDYEIEVLSALNEAGFEGPVGATWRDQTKELYVLSGSGEIKIINRAGIATRGSIIQLPADPFRAPQAIVYLGSDRFAVLNGGDTELPTIVFFHLRYDEEELLDDYIVYEIPDIDEATGGPVRGLAYDPWRDRYYIGTQSTAVGEGGLYEIDLHGASGTSSSLLYRWSDSVVHTDGITAGALLGSLTYSRNLGAGIANDSLFCLFHPPVGGGPNEQRQIVQIDIQSGEPISAFLHGMQGDLRGLTFSEHNEDMFIFATTTGINFWRFGHTGYTEIRTYLRQFFVKDIPYRGGLYLHNQEAQLGEAVVFINKDDDNRFAKDGAFGINVLPVFADEFFTQHEYRGNRYAQTLRNWGGAATIEFWADGEQKISEIDIADLDGYYWEEPDYGLHECFVRLRAAAGSGYYVDIPGYLRFRQFECPE